MTGGARPRAGARHVVAVLAAPAASVVELAVLAEALGPGGSLRRYDLRVCAVEPGPVPLGSGFSLDASHGLDALSAADTVVVPGGPAPAPEPPAALVRALRVAHARGARIVALHAGVLVLAAAGLLRGRRAAVHGDLADELRRRYPDVRADPSVLFHAEGSTVTCAGGAGTLDLCLELVRHDHGMAAAHALGATLAAPPHRSGENAQVVRPPLPERGDGLMAVLDWALARLDQPISLADLARAGCTSPRTLARRFHAALGTTPMQWLLTQRIRLAQQLLETTAESIDSIARAAGLGSAGNFRQLFTREVGLPPQQYRRAFQGQESHPARPGPRPATWRQTVDATR